jgi:hypothetical protein
MAEKDFHISEKYNFIHALISCSDFNSEAKVQKFEQDLNPRQRTFAPRPIIPHHQTI